MRMRKPPSQRRRRMRWALSTTGLGLVVLASCSNLGYYSQSLWGGADVLMKRRSVERMIADPSTPPDLRDRLEMALTMRGFAVDELMLPDNESYRKYSALDREYAMWNVVAAEELSVEPQTWCFLIAGCVAYRGYFSERRADRFAEKMRTRGYDVDVGGVAAYSTIGWFADPLLSTFIERPEPHLAGLIFHELAHQKVFVKGDTTFNESFAMAIEEHGALKWLERRGLHDEMEAYRRVRRWGREFGDLIAAYRERLAETYAAETGDEWKRQQKVEILTELRTEYAALKADWGGYSGFDGWFGRDLNNARLALIGVYHELVPAFLALLASHGDRLDSFYAEVAEIAALPAEERLERLGRDLATPGGEVDR